MNRTADRSSRIDDDILVKWPNSTGGRRSALITEWWHDAVLRSPGYVNRLYALSAAAAGIPVALLLAFANRLSDRQGQGDNRKGHRWLVARWCVCVVGLSSPPWPTDLCRLPNVTGDDLLLSFAVLQAAECFDVFFICRLFHFFLFFFWKF